MRQMVQALQRIDVRKPLHGVVIGAILAGILAPVINVLIVNEQYRMSDQIKAVAERPSPSFMNKLQYDKGQAANVFNAAGAAAVAANAKDKLQSSVGAGGKTDEQLYTATLPDDPTKGITVQDNVNNVSIGFKPTDGLLAGRSNDGHVVYPLKDEPGQMVFTPKANGLKEDIVLTSAPKADTTEFHYTLDIPDTVAARLESDGSIGFYTGDPQLYGNMTYGSDSDRTAVEKARVNAEKTYLMFSIPAPTLRETGKPSPVSARFSLSGKTLTVRATGLAKAHYPLSIDPTFLLTSTADFVLGSIDDNIDLSVANKVGRQPLVGGSTPGWTPNNAPSLAYAQFASALVAYNGFLYLIGGGSGAVGGGGTSNTTTNDVRYISLDPTTGALGGTAPTTWSQTGNGLLGTARHGLVAFGFNGYLYAVGGEDNAQTPITVASGHTTEYAKINADGTVGTWAYTASLNTARSYPAGAIYQGVLYVMGGTSGANNTTFLNTTEWARINGDGTISPWTVSSSAANGNLSSARSKFRGAASNGYVYVTGGQTSSSTVINTVEFAPIQSNGSLGAWVTTTAFPTARRDHGMTIDNGYVYVFGGCTGAAQACATFLGDTQYAVINADGSVGQWQSTLPYNTGGYNSRMPGGVTAYSNHLYFVGGCSAETATNKCATQLVGTFITNIDSVGRFDRGIQSVQTTAPFNNNAATVSRMGAQSVVLNGYLYLLGGCSTASCNTATSYSSVVEYAQLNADGSLGTFATTGALIDNSAGANNAGRIGMSVAAYNNKIYVIGGVERTTPGNVDAFRLDVLSSTQASNGTLPTFTAEANSLPVAKAFGSVVVWHNWIYVLGGLSAAASVVGTIYHAQIGVTNSPGSWTATTRPLTNARWGQSGGIWGNWIYAIGGQSTTTGTYITAANGAEQLTIDNNGDINTVAVSVQNVAGAPLTRLAGGFVHNGFLYTFGGYTSGSTAAVATMNWSALSATTGALGAWSATNIGNISGSTPGLATARGDTTAVMSGGNFYVLGGCTATLATTSFSSCATFVTAAQTTEVSLPNNGGTGQTNAFATATALPAATADHATVAYNGFLYQIGGCTAYTAGACTSGSNSSTIRYATISPDAAAPGVLSSWTTSATSLPVGRSLAQAVAYNGYLYVLGGQTDSTAAVGTVSYINITSTGVLGSTWNNADLPGGAGRNAFGAAVSNGYLYVAGGDNGSGTKKGDIYYAQLNTTDGSLATAWATETNTFTTARSGLSLVAYNGRLYVIGGTDGTNNLTDVQFAVQNNDGTLGTFSNTTDVPRGMSFRQAAGANGYMYFVGDEGDGTELNYADINANGTLGTIQRSHNTLAGAHAHGALSWFDGYFYVTGGCTMTAGVCTTGGILTSDEYAGQLAISRVGHYSKLFNTQVDTAPTQLVVNGAISGPGSAVEFRFQTASTADPVLGVAQVFRPVLFGTYYNVQALNSSGVNVGVAFNYLYIIALDDSRSGTFPDVPNALGSPFAQTAVTDITLNYHANPGRRLRHGASFTNTGCNPNVSATDGCILDTAP
jgi:hypothetical protein